MWFLNVLYFVFFVVSPSVNKQSSWQPVLSSGLRHHTHDKVKNLCWRVSLVGWLPYLVARCPPRLRARCLPQLVACCFRHPCARCLRCLPACCLLHLHCSYLVRVSPGCPGLAPPRCSLLAPPDCPLLVPSACPLPRPLFGKLLSPLWLESSSWVFQGRLCKLAVCFIDSQSDIGDTKFAPKMADDEKLARANAKRALTRQVNHIKQRLAENEIDNYTGEVSN